MLLQPVVKNRHAYASKRSRIQDFILKGAVGAYWGCCRGCGAHLIWVTSIDAFCLKKSLIAPGNLNYFTVLHIWHCFGTTFAILVTSWPWNMKKRLTATSLRTPRTH